MNRTDRTERARELRKSSPAPERVLWGHLRGGRLEGYKFRRQQPLGSFIVDFVCLEMRLVVELDGGQHSEHADEDSRRDEWLREQGFEVLRFWNNEVTHELDGVKTRILEKLKGGT